MIKGGFSTAENFFRPVADIFCDCSDCAGSREKLAEIRDGKLIIRTRRHGKEHVAYMRLDEIQGPTVKLNC
jgi:hypothetical protein